MKQSEIKELSDAEIIEKLDTLRDSLLRMKLNHAASPLESPIEIRKVRRDIARLETEKRRRELEIAREKVTAQ